jgi:hypothetical protein
MEQFKPSYGNTSSFNHKVSKTCSSKKGIDKGYHSPAQWAALSKEETDKILSAQGSRKNGDKKGKKGTKPDVNKCKQEAVITETAEAFSAITHDTEMAGTKNGNSSKT